MKPEDERREERKLALGRVERWRRERENPHSSPANPKVHRCVVCKAELPLEDADHIWVVSVGRMHESLCYPAYKRAEKDYTHSPRGRRVPVALALKLARKELEV